MVYHGTNQGEFYDLKEDPQEFFNLWDQPDFRRKQEYILKCFDASVLSMDPDPPRLGLFKNIFSKKSKRLEWIFKHVSLAFSSSHEHTRIPSKTTLREAGVAVPNGTVAQSAGKF